MVVSTPTKAPAPATSAAPIPKPVTDDAPALRADGTVPGGAYRGLGALITDPMAPRPSVIGPDAAGPAVSNGGFKFYDETTATGAIVDAVNGANQVVNAEFFGFSDAGKGARLVTALENAARRGVEVNVLTDFISAAALPIGSYQRMKSKIEGAGGNVILTSRVPGSPRARQTPALKHVDHRKVVTVDGNTGFVGGMNFVKLSDSYHDTMVGLTGVDAARLAAEQLDRWTRVGGNVTERHVRTVEQALGGAPVKTDDPDALSIVANAPEQQRFELTEGYRELIRNAKERLWIASPGISDRDVVADIADAARRGVDVRIVAPGTAPIAAPIGWVGRAHLEDIIKAGGTAWEIPETLHRKAIVADDETILSSYNLTKRSAEHDHELGVRTKNPKFVKAIADLLQHDMDRSTKFDPASFDGIGATVGRVFAKRISY